MRRRLGAIHSDSTDEFIETALKSEGKLNFYYNGNLKPKSKGPKPVKVEVFKIDSFDYISDTNVLYLGFFKLFYLVFCRDLWYSEPIN